MRLSRIPPWSLNKSFVRTRNDLALPDSHAATPLTADTRKPVSRDALVLPRPQVTWHQAVTLHQHFASLCFQGWHDDGSRVPGAVVL